LRKLGVGLFGYGEALIEHRRLLRQAFEQHNGVELGIGPFGLERPGGEPNALG
jgi:hypothetical protein